MTVDLQLIHEGGGRFRCSSRLDHGLATEKFEDGERVLAKVSRPRSGRQNRWFHSMLHDAWDNQTAGPRFDTSDRLRKWALIQVGHCDVKRFPPNAITREVAAWLRATRDDIDFATDGDCIYARTARSISYKACDSAAMTAIADKIIDVITEQIVPGSMRSDWEPYINGTTSKDRLANGNRNTRRKVPDASAVRAPESVG